MTNDVPAPRNTGFWGAVERFSLRITHDAAARERAFKWAWYVTMAFTLFGFAVIAYILLKPAA